eukprot:gene72-89_t
MSRFRSVSVESDTRDIIHNVEDEDNIIDIDMFGRTQLITNAKRGQLRSVQSLIQSGANIHHKDHWGFTALTWACLNGHMDVADALTTAGASMDEAQRQLLQVESQGTQGAASSATEGSPSILPSSARTDALTIACDKIRELEEKCRVTDVALKRAEMDLFETRTQVTMYQDQLTREMQRKGQSHQQQITQIQLADSKCEELQAQLNSAIRELTLLKMDRDRDRDRDHTSGSVEVDDDTDVMQMQIEMESLRSTNCDLEYRLDECEIEIARLLAIIEEQTLVIQRTQTQTTATASTAGVQPSLSSSISPSMDTSTTTTTGSATTASVTASTPADVAATQSTFIAAVHRQALLEYESQCVALEKQLAEAKVIRISLEKELNQYRSSPSSTSLASTSTSIASLLPTSVASYMEVKVMGSSSLSSSFDSSKVSLLPQYGMGTRDDKKNLEAGGVGGGWGGGQADHVNGGDNDNEDAMLVETVRRLDVVARELVDNNNNCNNNNNNNVLQHQKQTEQTHIKSSDNVNVTGAGTVNGSGTDLNTLRTLLFVCKEELANAVTAIATRVPREQLIMCESRISDLQKSIEQYESRVCVLGEDLLLKTDQLKRREKELDALRTSLNEQTACLYQYEMSGAVIDIEKDRDREGRECRSRLEMVTAVNKELVVTVSRLEEELVELKLQHQHQIQQQQQQQQQLALSISMSSLSSSTRSDADVAMESQCAALERELEDLRNTYQCLVNQLDEKQEQIHTLTTMREEDQEERAELDDCRRQLHECKEGKMAAEMKYMEVCKELDEMRMKMAMKSMDSNRIDNDNVVGSEQSVLKEKIQGVEAELKIAREESKGYKERVWALAEANARMTAESRTNKDNLLAYENKIEEYKQQEMQYQNIIHGLKAEAESRVTRAELEACKHEAKWAEELSQGIITQLREQLKNKDNDLVDKITQLEAAHLQLEKLNIDISLTQELLNTANMELTELKGSMSTLVSRDDLGMFMSRCATLLTECEALKVVLAENGVLLQTKEQQLMDMQAQLDNTIARLQSCETQLAGCHSVGKEQEDILTRRYEDMMKEQTMKAQDLSDVISSLLANHVPMDVFIECEQKKKELEKQLEEMTMVVMMTAVTNEKQTVTNEKQNQFESQQKDCETKSKPESESEKAVGEGEGREHANGVFSDDSTVVVVDSEIDEIRALLAASVAQNEAHMSTIKALIASTSSDLDVYRSQLLACKTELMRVSGELTAANMELDSRMPSDMMYVYEGRISELQNTIEQLQKEKMTSSLVSPLPSPRNGDSNGDHHSMEKRTVEIAKGLKDDVENDEKIQDIQNKKLVATTEATTAAEAEAVVTTDDEIAKYQKRICELQQELMNMTHTIRMLEEDTDNGRHRDIGVDVDKEGKETVVVNEENDPTTVTSTNTKMSMMMTMIGKEKSSSESDDVMLTELRREIEEMTQEIERLRSSRETMVLHLKAQKDELIENEMRREALERERNDMKVLYEETMVQLEQLQLQLHSNSESESNRSQQQNQSVRGEEDIILLVTRLSESQRQLQDCQEALVTSRRECTVLENKYVSADRQWKEEVDDLRRRIETKERELGAVRESAEQHSNALIACKTELFDTVSALAACQTDLFTDRERLFAVEKERDGLKAFLDEIEVEEVRLKQKEERQKELLQQQQKKINDVERNMMDNKYSDSKVIDTETETKIATTITTATVPVPMTVTVPLAETVEHMTALRAIVTGLEEELKHTTEQLVNTRGMYQQSEKRFRILQLQHITCSKDLETFKATNNDLMTQLQEKEHMAVTVSHQLKEKEQMLMTLSQHLEEKEQMLVTVSRQLEDTKTLLLSMKEVTRANQLMVDQSKLRIGDLQSQLEVEQRQNSHKTVETESYVADLRQMLEATKTELNFNKTATYALENELKQMRKRLADMAAEANKFNSMTKEGELRRHLAELSVVTVEQRTRIAILEEVTTDSQQRRGETEARCAELERKLALLQAIDRDREKDRDIGNSSSSSMSMSTSTPRLGSPSMSKYTSTSESVSPSPSTSSTSFPVNKSPGTMVSNIPK